MGNRDRSTAMKPRLLVCCRVSAIVVLPALFLNWQFAPPARCQPTYKLDVKPDLKPLATLKLEGDPCSAS